MIWKLVSLLFSKNDLIYVRSHRLTKYLSGLYQEQVQACYECRRASTCKWLTSWTTWPSLTFKEVWYYEDPSFSFNSEKYLSPCFFSAYVNYAEASRSWLIIQMCLLYISSMLVLSLFAHLYLFFMNLLPISGDKRIELAHLSYLLLQDMNLRSIYGFREAFS